MEGYEIDRLVEELFEKNKQKFKLSLKSDPQKGYVIDHQGSFLKYLKKEEAGWEKLTRENPEAFGRMDVSLPVWNKQKNVILIYISFTYYESGTGYIISYSFEKGLLRELGRVAVWFS